MKNLMKKFSISPFEQIKKKIKCKDFKVAIIGLGYVGLPLALNFCENEIKVIGIDINEDYLNKLKKGESYIHHIPSNRINKQIKNNFFYPTNDFKNISEADALIICVPTPLTNHREPDIRYIISTLESINKHIREGQIIILESTTYPGTTEEVIQPRLEKEGFKIGDNLFLVYSPEREDPGNKTYNSNNTPKILGGTTKKCSILGKMVYENIINNIVVVSSTKVAEMTKLVENVHRAVNIGLVNELKTLTDSLKIDIYEVINAAATKPFGFTPFYPGPGLGGHCIPIDPFYLSWKAKEFDVNLKFIELAGEINSSMPKYILEKISTSLNAISKSLKDSNILILGLSYKKNVDDIRESPALRIANILKKKGYNFDYSDPYVDKIIFKSKVFKSKKLTSDLFKKYPIVLILTDHKKFNYRLVSKRAKYIFDTRNTLKSRVKNYFKI